MKIHQLKIISICILVVCCNVLGFGQKKIKQTYSINAQAIKNPIYKSILEASRDLEAQKSLEKIGIKGDVNEWFAGMNYSDKTINDLKKSGIDIIEALRNFYGRDEKAKAALSDCIVIGYVSSIEYDSGKVPYHTIAHIAVEKYIRNDYHLKEREILVMLESGPVGKGSWGRASHEDSFVKDERVLLFLSASGFLIDNKYNSPEYLTSLLNENVVRFKMLGSSTGKYQIMGDDIICHQIIKGLKETLHEIEEVTKTLNYSRNKN